MYFQYKSYLLNHTDQLIQIKQKNLLKSSELALQFVRKTIIMRKNQQNQDQQDFEVLLSRTDYDELKKYKSEYQKVERQYKTKIKNSQQSINVMQQKFVILNNQNDKLKALMKSIQNKINDTYQSIKLKCSLSGDLIKKELPQLGKIVNLQNLSGQFIDQALLQKINTIQTVIDKSFKLFIQKISNQHKQTNELTKTVTNLNNQINQLKYFANQRSQEYNYLEIQNKNLHDKYQQDMKKLSKRLQQFQLQHNNNKSQIFKQKQQNSLLKQQIITLKQKLISTQKVCDSFKKQSQLMLQQNQQYMRQIKQKQDQIKQYQNHISNLKNKEANNRKHTGHKKQSPGRNSSKFQKEDYIKETLVQYVRQIRKNLISIGNLSQQEIRQIGTSQLRTLIKFIQQLQEDFE